MENNLMDNILINVRRDIERQAIESAINSNRETKRIAKNIKIGVIRSLRKQHKELRLTKQNLTKTFERHERDILNQINKLKFEINKPIRN